jgi:hypothetical protein
MPYLPIIRCGSYTLPPFIAPVNKYFTQSGGPDASTEKFPGDLITSSTIIYAYAETGTVATKGCSDENLWKSQLLQPRPIINTAPICNNFTTGNKTNSYNISNYTSNKYSFEWRSADGTLLSTANDFSTDQAGNYTLTVTDLSILIVHQIPLLLPLKKYPPSHISHLHY